MIIIIKDMSDAFDDRYDCRIYNDTDCYCRRCMEWRIRSHSVGMFLNKFTGSYEALCENCISNNTEIGAGEGVIFYDSLEFEYTINLGERVVYFKGVNGELLNSNVAAII